MSPAPGQANSSVSNLVEQKNYGLPESFRSQTQVEDEDTPPLCSQGHQESSATLPSGLSLSANDQAHGGPANEDAENPSSTGRISYEEHEAIINNESEVGELAFKLSSLHTDNSPKDDGWQRQVSGASTVPGLRDGPKAQDITPEMAYPEAGPRPTLRQWKLERYERYLNAAMTGVGEEDSTKDAIRGLRPEEIGVKRSSFLYCPSGSSNDATPNKSGVNEEELTRPCCSSERSSFENLGIA
ncbi:uncharacterized protein J3D65DRAFT_600867 [Phyllosticta citribraziliensis]|uniref:Uncharacterized protein n=1 Tax=Phyllosticta citribraziliensis TaxID=989973 RepID=A0ABR1M017_9PEZI